MGFVAAAVVVVVKSQVEAELLAEHEKLSAVLLELTVAME